MELPSQEVVCGDRRIEMMMQNLKDLTISLTIDSIYLRNRRYILSMAWQTVWIVKKYLAMHTERFGYVYW